MMNDEGFSALGKYIAAGVSGTGVVALFLRWWVLRISKDLTIVQNDKGERSLYTLMHEQLLESRELVKRAEQNEDLERRQKEEAIRHMDKAIKDHAACLAKLEQHEDAINDLKGTVTSLENALTRKNDPATGQPIDRRNRRNGR